MKIILAFILAVLVFIAYNLYQKPPQADLPSSSDSPQTEPLDETQTSSPNPHPDWLVYQDPNLGFQISYPSNYEIVEDNYGWPNAVFMLYSGGQSYELVIEKWDNSADYLQKYANNPNITVVQDASITYTLLNNNMQPEVTDIISTFKL